MSHGQNLSSTSGEPKFVAQLKNFEIPASVGSNKVTADSVPGTAGGKQMDWTHWLL